MLKIYLDRDMVFVNPSIANKKELFEFLAKKAHAKSLVTNEQTFLQNLWEREEKGATILSKGVALPHARSNAVKQQFVALCIFRKGLPFGEGRLAEKVEIVLLIGTTEGDPSYLFLLADISRLLKKENFRKGLVKANVVEDVLKIISEHSIQEFVTKVKEKPQYQVVLILNHPMDEELLSSILLEAGVRTLTEIPSSNLFSKSFRSIPFLSALASSVRNSSTGSRTILGITDDRDAASKIYTLLKTENLDLEQPGVGALWTTEMTNCFGGIHEDLEF